MCFYLVIIICLIVVYFYYFIYVQVRYVDVLFIYIEGQVCGGQGDCDFYQSIVEDLGQIEQSDFSCKEFL